MAEMKIQMMDIDSIHPYENNPRKNEKAIEAVANSIEKFGFKNPIIVDKDNVIISGHTRRLAAISLGLKEVPVIVGDDLTEEQVKIEASRCLGCGAGSNRRNSGRGCRNRYTQMP